MVINDYANPDAYNRSAQSQQIYSMPKGFDLVQAGEKVAGHYTAIQFFWATTCEIANNTTSIVMDGVGVNLSSLSNKMPKGTLIRGHFTYIESPDTGHDTVYICYKAG